MAVARTPAENEKNREPAGEGAFPQPLGQMIAHARAAKTDADRAAGAWLLFDGALALLVAALTAHWPRLKPHLPAPDRLLMVLAQPGPTKLIALFGYLARAAELAQLPAPWGRVYRLLTSASALPRSVAFFNLMGRGDLADRGTNPLALLDGLGELRERTLAGSPEEVPSFALLESVIELMSALKLRDVPLAVAAVATRDPANGELRVGLAGIQSADAVTFPEGTVLIAGHSYMAGSDEWLDLSPLVHSDVGPEGRSRLLILQLCTDPREPLVFTDLVSGMVVSGGVVAAGGAIEALGVKTDDAEVARVARAELGRIRKSDAAPVRSISKDKIGEFEILEPLGAGGMGEVVRAWQPSLARPVALKFLPPDLARNPLTVARFKTEPMVLSLCNHPNVVRVMTSGEAGERHYYAMEFIDGLNLAELLGGLCGRTALNDKTVREVASTATQAEVRSAWRIQWDRAGLSENQAAQSEMDESYFREIARIVAAAAHGLAHLHEQRVVHRDIKPANIMLMRDELRPVIMDLGLARLWNSDMSLGTQSIMVLGTLRYMAPEQVGSGAHTVDAKADIYSLGAVLYELATLKAFVSAPTFPQLQYQVVWGSQPQPRDGNPSIPEGLATIIEIATSKPPFDRFESAYAMADALDDFCRGIPIPPKQRSRAVEKLPPMFSAPISEVSAEEYRLISEGISSASSEEEVYRARMAYTGLRYAKKLNRAVDLRVETILDAQRLGRRLAEILGATGVDEARAAVVSADGTPQNLAIALRQFEQYYADAAEVDNSVGIRFRRLPAGVFEMGDNEFSDNPTHNVTLTRAFYMATCPVTNRQFRQFKAGHDSGDFMGHDLDAPDQPVVRLSWAEAHAFCNWLSEREGRKYRLPTEAEWEYCARAGRPNLESRFPWHDTPDPGSLASWPPPRVVGNFADETFWRAVQANRPAFSYDDGHVASSPVGSFPANDWGLFDMAGNVWEWCSDWYEPTACMHAANDPQGPSEYTIGMYKVFRGGASFRNNDRKGLMTAARCHIDAAQRLENLGFRVILECNAQRASRKTGNRT